MKKVRKVIKYKAFVGSNDEILRDMKSGFQEFDENGNLTKEVQYTASGEIESANGYKYDDKHRVVEEIHYYEEEEIGEIIKYKLDDEGKRLAVEITYGDGSVSTKNYLRLKDMITVKTTDEDGDIEAEEVVKIDEHGNALEELHFDEDQNIVTRFINVYDKDHHMISRTEFGENDEFMRKVTVEYDADGNASLETHLNRKDKIIDQVAFTYDKDGNRTVWENSVYINKTLFDANQRPVREERMNRRNNLVEEFTDYTYDEEGKVLSEKTFSMGEEYELEPGAVTRTKSDFILTRYEYEYF